MQVVGCGEEDETDWPQRPENEEGLTRLMQNRWTNNLSIICKSDRMGSKTPTGDTGCVSPALWQSQSGVLVL